MIDIQLWISRLCIECKRISWVYFMIIRRPLCFIGSILLSFWFKRVASLHVRLYTISYVIKGKQLLDFTKVLFNEMATSIWVNKGHDWLRFLRESRCVWICQSHGQRLMSNLCSSTLNLHRLTTVTVLLNFRCTLQQCSSYITVHSRSRKTTIWKIDSRLLFPNQFSKLLDCLFEIQSMINKIAICC